MRKPFDVPQLVAMVREVALTRVETASANAAELPVAVEKALPVVEPN